MIGISGTLFTGNRPTFKRVLIETRAKLLPITPLRILKMDLIRPVKAWPDKGG
jgi:hypothetical protein